MAARCIRRAASVEDTPASKGIMTSFGPRFIRYYIAAIEWFIPAAVWEDAATRTRARNVLNAVAMAALSGPFYAYIYHALGYTAAARVILTCCVGMFVAPFLMRLTKSIVVAREVFLCAVFFNFSWLTYAMGGVSAPTAGWMVVPPMVAVFLGGFATAMFWLGLTCAAIVLIYALPLLGIPLPSHPIEDMELLYVLCDFGLYVVIVFFMILFDLTKTQGFVKLQQALDFISELATRDALTGSHKRRHMLKLAEAQRDAGDGGGGGGGGGGEAGFSLCLLGIDDFRRINAQRGHAVGDLVLRECVQAVQKQLRDADSFGRYGASEFLWMLPATTQEEALALAENVRAAVQALSVPGVAPELRFTVSIGVAQFRPGESVGQTIARADEALCQAASSGRNRVVGYGQAPEAAPAAPQSALDLADSTRLDPLTGLLGRRVLRDRLGHAMARAVRNERKVALMLLNVNEIEDINQAFGIGGGDAVLAQTARLVRSMLHESDTVVRWSGHEFIVVLEDLQGADYALQAAERILDQFSFPLVVDERQCPVSLSIGIALFPAPSCDLDALLARAGVAMTRARNWGGNQVHLYGADAGAPPSERLTLKNHLRDALAANQFVLEYQPQLDLASGRICGVEALVRWAHPQYGRIEPARFIPLAEETGLIVPLGEWVLRTACLQNVAWRQAGLPPLRTAVNLSLRQLQQPGMAAQILATIRETGIDPGCLALDIAESALADAAAPHLEGLHLLRRAGVHIAIDDFGSGHSSLGRLAALPVDTLKMDRSFVAGLGQAVRDEAAHALAGAIVDLAHRLRLSVIAEAVETEAQLAELRAIGCDAVQGFGFQRPLDPGRVTELIRQQLARPSPVASLEARRA